MSTLKQKAQNILAEKTNKIIPENIKKDIQIFDITGTLKERVKLFDTVANMQADPNPQEGDLAVVYREPVPATSADSFDSCVFPSEVVLDEAVINDFNTYYSGSAGEHTAMLKASSFTFVQSGGQQRRITYSSQDGITYTRTDGGAEKIDFQGTLALTYPTMWIDSIGKFILINGPVFDGFYKYTNNAYIEITKN